MMNFDEFVQQTATKAKERRDKTRQQVPSAVMEFRRTVVAMELITGDEVWDRYLEILESRAQEIEGEIANFRSMIENPDTDPKDVPEMHRKLIANKLIAKTIRECMAVPKTVLNVGRAIDEGEADAGGHG